MRHLLNEAHIHGVLFVITDSRSNGHVIQTYVQQNPASEANSRSAYQDIPYKTQSQFSQQLATGL
jgi:hypothetical protein